MGSHRGPQGSGCADGDRKERSWVQRSKPSKESREIEHQRHRSMTTSAAIASRMMETQAIRIAVVVLFMELVLHVFSKSLVRRGTSRSAVARVPSAGPRRS